ncbi:MAG: hypothetical protein MI755_17925, partial [Sphingomonadales bacterium]|nr:hypothetical protein [Sphingomonadales bacterium]
MSPTTARHCRKTAQPGVYQGRTIKMPRTSLKSGASWVALAVFGAAATIAQAQDDEDATSNRGIELIVVTAEKTEKSLQ